MERMIRGWYSVTTRPGRASFDEVRPHANLGLALLGIAIAGFLSAILNFVSSVVFGATILGLARSIAGEDFAGAALPTIATLFGGGLGVVLGPLVTVIGFLIGSGVLYVLAMIFGGEGTFTEQSYLLSLFQAPLNIVSSVLGLIPLAGACLNVGVWIYGLVLGVFAIQSSHRLTTGRAAAVVLLPAAFVVVMVGCAVLLAVLFLIPIYREVGGV